MAASVSACVLPSLKTTPVKPELLRSSRPLARNRVCTVVCSSRADTNRTIVNDKAQAEDMMANRKSLSSLLVGSAAAVLLLSVGVNDAMAESQKALAVLKGTAGVGGTVTVVQEDSGATSVTYNISGLAPGKHGFHVHKFGDLSNGCISAGPHFNPKNLTHGAPTDGVRHVGDLGNILADAAGVAQGTIIDSQVALQGPNSIIGRAFVVHELEDDLGKGGSELSPTTGNAGGRLACGVTGIAPL